MGVRKYHKLVRDRIPEIIEASGKSCVTETLSEEEYLRMVDAKLDEELVEYHNEPNLEELADIMEVLFALAKDMGYEESDLIEENARKRGERGSFEDRIVLRMD